MKHLLKLEKFRGGLFLYFPRFMLPKIEPFSPFQNTEKGLPRNRRIFTGHILPDNDREVR